MPSNTAFAGLSGHVTKQSLNDISTFSGTSGAIVKQTMGSTAGYAEYLRLYAMADDKAKFNAEYQG